MPERAHFRRVCFPLYIAALVFLSSFCYAIPMRVNVGFDGVQKSGFWTPVAVSLENASEENVEGTILIRGVTGDRRALPLCTVQVDLPRHSKKVFHTYVRLPEYGGPIVVTLDRRGGVLATKTVNINPASLDDKLVVSIGNRASRLSFLQGETIRVPPRTLSNRRGPGPTEANIHAGSIAPSFLPDRPAAFEGVDVMVISDLSADSTDRDALDAICAWVASGGTLVISAGANYRVYSGNFYKELLPVKITGATSVPGLDCLKSLGKADFPSAAVAVADSSVKPDVGRALASQSGVPIVVERDYGLGRVIYLAFDHKSSPFRDWRGQTEFWKGILRVPPREPIAATNTGERGRHGYYPGPIPGHWTGQPQALGVVVAQNPSVKAPSFNTISLFLLAYLVILVPVNYFVLRRRRRLELAWVTTPAVILLFTVGAYAIGYTMKGGDLRLREAVLIEGSCEARFARKTSMASVFSPARRSYDVTIADAHAISQAISAEEREVPPVAYIGETSVMPDVPMAMWSSKSFEAVSGTDLGGCVTADLTLEGGRLRGVVRNNTGLNLENCALVYGTARQDIGHIKKGGSAKADLQCAGSSGGGPRPRSYYYGNDRTPLSQRLLDYARRMSQTVGQPVLVAAVESAKPAFGISNADPVSEHATSCVFRLSYRASGSFTLAPEMMQPQIIEISDHGYERSSRRPGMISVWLDGSGPVTASFHVPMPPNSVITELSLVGIPAGVTVTIHNTATGAWDEVQKNQSIRNPRDYLSAGSEVRVNFKGNDVELQCGISVSGKTRQ